MPVEEGALFQEQGEAERFAQGLATRAVGRSLTYLRQCDSTNSRLAEEAREGAPHGKVIVTDFQTAGRGRRGRSWEAPSGRSLLLSVLFRHPDLPSEALGWLPLAAGLAVLEALDPVRPSHFRLKWPNDIVVPCAGEGGLGSWRKLGGILCEGSLSAQGGEVGGRSPAQSKACVVVGIGFNVLQQGSDLPELAKAPATSLLLETGRSLDRRALLGQLLVRLDEVFLEMADPYGGAELRRRVAGRLSSWWAGRQLHVRQGEQELVGRYEGLDRFGRLCLALPGAEVCALADGEVLGWGG